MCIVSPFTVLAMASAPACTAAHAAPAGSKAAEVSVFIGTGGAPRGHPGRR
jgi:hypothetical protein